MKIREGLVSNSSSSSYFFKVKDLKFKDFVDIMVSNYWFDYFNKPILNHEIKENMKKSIESHKKNSKIYSRKKSRLKPGESLYKIMDKLHKEHIADCKNNLAELAKCSTNKDLVEFVLKHKEIKTNVSNGGIEFSYFTSMHNDFNEGMDDLLKEIVMYFSFDTKYKTEFRREDDEGKNPKEN